MTDVVIAGAARTPVGSFSGAMSSLSASELGRIAVSAALERAGIEAGEVDEVLLDHDAVGQVVTFAMPHPKLGEDVAAAVVLREGASCTEAELRDFARQRLAEFKVPRKILFLAEIPKGATGKLQRIGLAEKLGLGAGA